MDHVRSIKRSDYASVSLLISISVLMVLFLHHRGYTYFNDLDMFSHLNDNYLLTILANFAVAGFVFLSGYKLTKSDIKTPLKEFWKKRFIRIYPFYFIALVLFSLIVMENQSLKDFLIHVFLIQTIVPEHSFEVGTYLTLWFMGILFFYYLFFSFSRKYISHLKIFIVACFSLFFLLIYIKLITSYVSFEVPLYLLIFCSGMIYSYYDSKINLRKKDYFYFVILSGTSFYLLYLVMNQVILNHLIFMSLFLLFFSVPLFILILSIKIKNKTLIKGLDIMAYASYATFLFHRPIWEIMKYLWSDQSILQWAYISIFGTMIIFCFALFIQSLYDRILRSFLINKIKSHKSF